MWKNKLGAAQLWAWTAVAVSAPAAQFAAGSNWTGTVLTALLCGILIWIGDRVLPENPEYGKFGGAILWLWNSLAVSQVMGFTAGCWPEGETTVFLPICLAVLAAASVYDGALRGARVGATVLWLTAILYLLVVVAAVKEIQICWLRPESPESNPALATGLLTIPASLALREEKGRGAGWIAGILIFPVVISACVSGVLSPDRASGVNGFYELSRSLSLFGMIKRFEALVSVAMTVGWFCLMSLLLAGAARQSREKGFGTVSAAAAAIVLFLLEVKISAFVWILGAVGVWILLPLALRKKARKNENNA